MTLQNKAIFSLVYQLHAADNEINIKELGFMREIADTLHLSATDLNEISADPKAYVLEPPPPEQERMSILYMLLFAMRIDGEINTNEEHIVYKVGLQLGFHELMLKELIGELKSHLTTRLPDDALLNIIKKYLN